MILLLFFAQIYGAIQLFLLSSFARRIRWPILFVAFFAGMSASGTAAFFIERIFAVLIATLSGQSSGKMPRFDFYAIDPFIEEFCKVLPLLFLLLNARVRAKLGFTDLVVICAALGSGFGFTESALRYGGSASAARWDGAFWLINGAFGSIVVPGFWELVRSWLPAGGSVLRLFGQPAVGLNYHLIESALVGFGIGVALKASGRWRWLALLPIALACFGHAAANAAQLNVLPALMSSAFPWLWSIAGYYPIAALVAAFCLDRWHDRSRLFRLLRRIQRAALRKKLRVILLAAILLPPSVYFVFGDFPATSTLQRAADSRVVFYLLIALLLLCMAWRSVTLVKDLRDFAARWRTDSDTAILLRGLSLSGSAGALLFGLFVLVALPGLEPLLRVGPRLDIQYNWSLGTALTLVMLAVALLALTAILAPEILEALGLLQEEGGITLGLQNAEAAETAGPGAWEAVNESMSPNAAAYQAQITGASGQAYVVNGVRFDGFNSADGLLEAKGPGYANFVSNGEFQSWFSGADSLAAQAGRQLGAAGGVPITWSVAEPEAAEAIGNLFQSRGIQGISIVNTPFTP